MDYFAVVRCKSPPANIVPKGRAPPPRVSMSALDNADPDAPQTTFISHVSDDLLVLMLSTLPAADLRLAAATCSHWRECVPTASEIRLRRRRRE
eukprot:scaffold39512_cov63-Phaeocystis_antarctica.AAC.2